MTQNEDWAATWSAQIGQYIQAKRRAKHLTGEQLAARTRELGYEVTRSTIANIESGRRDVVSVQQITVLAMALDTSPVVLLFDPREPQTELLPGDVMSGIEASEWWSGNWAATHLLTDPSKRFVTHPDYDLLEQRKVFHMQRALRKAVNQLTKLEATAPVDADPTFGLELSTAKHRVSTAAKYLAEAAGGHRSSLPTDAVAMLDKLVERGMFTWPEDLVAKVKEDATAMRPWPGEERWEADLA